MTAAPQARSAFERRSAAIRFDRSRALSDSTRLWRALSEAADRAAVSFTLSPQQAEERRTRLLLAVERVVHLCCGFDEPPELQLSELYDEDIRALRAEFLAGMQSRPAAIDVWTLAGAVTAFDSLLHEVDGARDGYSTDELVEVAHDMQSPLSSILFLADTLRRACSGPVNPVQERQLGLVYGAAFGLSTLVSDLLDSVRGHRLLAGDPLPFSVREMMLHVCSIVQPVAEEKRLTLTTVFPEVDGRVGYAPAISRVLLNLTTNALKVTEHGSVTIGCYDVSAQMVEFWVSDTGGGIPDAMRAALSDSAGTAGGRVTLSSAGLGLGICRSLLDAIGSSLQFDTGSTGTRFSFRLEMPAVR